VTHTYVRSRALPSNGWAVSTKGAILEPQADGQGGPELRVGVLHTLWVGRS
jgi:hypothetical protein